MMGMWTNVGKRGGVPVLIVSMRDLAATAKGRRLSLGLTQAEVASRAGISRDWVNYFERGKRTVELDLVFRVLEALSLKMEVTEATLSPSGSIDLESWLEEYQGSD
jgi:transcriptional regulator with XRE-family HTH domain